MRSLTLLPLAAVAGAIVIPDAQVFAEVPIEHHQRPAQQHGDDSSWLDWLPSTDAISSTVHDIVDTFTSGKDTLEHAIDDVKSKFEAEFDSLLDDTEDPYGFDTLDSKPSHSYGHKTSNLTIYELISQSKYTTKFAKLVDEYDDIVELLNSTSANYTLFVPVDAAFKHIPEDKKPSREFVEAVLKYHIGLGLYPAGRVLVTHTLPTALDEPLLGDKPQRLRTSAGVLSGVRVNFYSKVIAIDIVCFPLCPVLNLFPTLPPNLYIYHDTDHFHSQQQGAKNGVIHAVKSILIPPPMVGREISLFPSKFSTLLLAFDKTNFTSFVHGVKMTGSTVFAPDNSAFQKLGPAANAFLFNSPRGLGYLKAILKYHVVPNEVVYSDAYYSSSDEAEARDDVGRGHYHLDVPTLLEEKTIAIDVARFAGFIRVKLNGYIPVVVQDGIAKNGVIHLPGRVLIPPHKHGKHGSEAVGGEISVEELVERLGDYVDEADRISVGDKGEFEL